MAARMKVIAVEEHFATPEAMDAWAGLPAQDHDDSTDIYMGPPGASLLDLADGRVQWMDRMGVDVQVLSMTTPGVVPLKAGPAVKLARQTNDLIAQTVRAHPGRFQGFATLATPDPQAAARELRRAVCELGLQGAMIFGRTGERNLDHPDNEPIFAAANELRAPLFVHPQLSQRRVRDALYSDLPAGFDFAIAAAGLGWHYETGVQLLRMVLAGVFDRYPNLQVILGHWGDLIVFYLDEIEVLPRLARAERRPISDYFREHVYVAPSGTLSLRYLKWAIEVLGVERILFALDYPFAPRSPGEAREFLEQASPSGAEREQIACRNWEGLVERIGS